MSRLNGRVLLVDPDPISVGELSRGIEDLGPSVITARTGDEGLAAFWDHLPDLVFVDILRVGDNGERMCRELKRTDYGVITPIVIHSEREPSLSRLELMRSCGAIDYILKPAQQAKVQTLLEWVLAERADAGQRIRNRGLDAFDLSSSTDGVVSLESGSLPYLLGRAEEEKLSGLLLLIAGEHKSALLFRDGLIVGAASNARSEQIERVLVSMRKLTPAQLRDVQKKARGGDLIPLLSFLNILDADQRNEVLRYQALTIGVSMFAESSGQLQFLRGESLDCSLLGRGIRPTTLALIGLRKNASLLEAATTRFVRDPVVFAQPPARSRSDVRTLPLTKFERTVLSSIDGERSVKELRDLGRLAQIDLDEPLALLVGSGILKPLASASTSAPKRVVPPVQVPIASGSPMSGSLSERPFIDLIGSLLREEATGLLTVDGPMRRTFTIVRREIVHARSSRAEDQLGRLLVMERLVTREALDRALTAQRQRPERRIGSLLVAQHAMTPDALARSLRSQVLAIIEDTFGWHVGRYEFEPSAESPEWSVRLDIDPIALLRRGTYKMSHRQLEGRWAETESRLIADAVEHEHLTSPERELLRMCEGRGLDLSTSGVSVLRRAHLLVAAGCAHVESKPRRPRAVPSPSADTGATEENPEGAQIGSDAPTPANIGLAEQATVSASESRWEAVARSEDVSAGAQTRPERAQSGGERASRREGEPSAPAPATDGASTAAILAFLKEQLVAEKREIEARLRWTEVELRRAMEELGRLREKTSNLAKENEELRRILPAGATFVVEAAGEDGGREPATRKTAKKAAKRTAKRTAKKTARKTAKKATRKTAKKVAKRVAKKKASARTKTTRKVAATAIVGAAFDPPLQETIADGVEETIDGIRAQETASDDLKTASEPDDPDVPSAAEG